MHDSQIIFRMFKRHIDTHVSEMYTYYILRTCLVTRQHCGNGFVLYDFFFFFFFFFFVCVCSTYNLRNKAAFKRDIGGCHSQVLAALTSYYLVFNHCTSVCSTPTHSSEKATLCFRWSSDFPWRTPSSVPPSSLHRLKRVN